MPKVTRNNPYTSHMRAAIALILTLLATHAGAWDHSTPADPLTGKAYKLATLDSADQLALEAPYQGENFGHLTVRRSTRAGLDVWLSIDRGQLVCGFGPDGCRVLVTLDGGAPVAYSMTKPAGGEPRLLFFARSDRFVRAVAGARTIKVAAVVYQAGEQVLTFRTSTGLAQP